MNVKLKVLLIPAISFMILLGIFQNCAKGIDKATVQEEMASSMGPSIHLTSLDMLINTSQPLSATDGVPPYVFSIDSGPATVVDGTTLQAGASQGPVVIRVTDSIGNTAMASLNVVLDLVAGPGGCISGNITLRDQQSIVAYAAASVSCTSTCVKETRNCAAGVLSGSYTNLTCAVPACLYRWINAANVNETQAQACARVGKDVAADQGYGICASGESRPVVGADYAAIKYSHGTFGGTSMGGVPVGVVSGGKTSYFCYRSGQKRDGDGSDLVVAYLCKDR